MKKGDATMVATVLLIVMAIVTGVLVMSFSRESEKKVEKKIISLGSAVECQDVGLGVEEEDTKIKITNRGTLGIDKIIVRGYAETGLPFDSVTVTIWDSDINYNHKLDSKNVRTESVVTDYHEYPVNKENVKKLEFIPVII